MHGEERIARAVIAQALSDAGLGIESGRRLSVSAIERDRARNFLTAAAGEWKEARECWACMADLNPDDLRTRAMRALGIEPLPRVEAPKQARNEPIRLFYPVPKPEKPKRVPAPKPQVLSKRRQVADMLMRPEGVSVDEIVERFGWKRATAHTCVRFDVRNYGIQGLRCRDGRYRAFSLPESGNLCLLSR